MARKPTKSAPVVAGEVEIECTCDRIPLESGALIVRGQRAAVPARHADNYIAAEKARRV